MTIRVDVPLGVWVDVYATAGLTDGVTMLLQNLSNSEVWITELATEPTTPFGQVMTKVGTETSQATVAGGSAKIWLMAKGYPAVVAVED